MFGELFISAKCFLPLAALLLEVVITSLNIPVLSSAKRINPRHRDAATFWSPI